ncbi:MAG TPA: hypothetical protein VFX37_09650 [Pseudolabrys sp.]|nr:hypothetical protein [Pseudolabrys sp.]
MTAQHSGLGQKSAGLELSSKVLGPQTQCRIWFWRGSGTPCRYLAVCARSSRKKKHSSRRISGFNIPRLVAKSKPRSLSFAANRCCDLLNAIAQEKIDAKPEAGLFG